MTIDYGFVSGDTGSVLRVTVVDKETKKPIPLTTPTYLEWIDQTGRKITREMEVTDADNGIAQYKFQAGELYAPEMEFEVKTGTDPTDVLTSLQLIDIPVRKRLGG